MIKYLENNVFFFFWEASIDAKLPQTLAKHKDL